MKKTETYQKIISLGFNPNVIVDCGAGWGEWTGFVRSLFPNSYIISVDANPWTGGEIPNANVTRIETLSNNDGEEMIFYRKKENYDSGTFCTGDSLFKENTQHYQSHNTSEFIVKTKTLKSILVECNKGKIDLLKIDTQGSEILIMEGMGSLLNEVEFLELECSLINYNLGGCSFFDIQNFLKDNFEIFDIVEFHYHNSFLSQIDVIFKNKNSKIKKII